MRKYLARLSCRPKRPAGAHDRLKSLLTIPRNTCSRSSEIRALDPLKRARSQPPVLVAEPLVHPSPHLLAQLLQLADHPLPLGLLAEEKASVSGLAAVMREAQEVEHLRP